MKSCKCNMYCVLRRVFPGTTLVFLLLFAVPVYALDTLSLLEAGPSKILLESKKPIHAETTGLVSIRFSQALEVYARPSLLTEVQQAYCELLTKDGTPEFTIRQESTNDYFYVNRKGQRTNITEVLRRQTSDDAFDIILYSTGKRFFGSYQAIIHVQLTRESEESTRYTASVYAYPENRISRFFARSMNLVERYFKKKTAHLTEIVTTISCSLCAQMDEA